MYVHLCVCVPDCSISYRVYIVFGAHLQKHQMVAVKGWSMCASLSLFSARLFIIAFLLNINFVSIQKHLMIIQIFAIGVHWNAFLQVNNGRKTYWLLICKRVVIANFILLYEVVELTQLSDVVYFFHAIIHKLIS